LASISSYEEFIGRPLADFVALTPRQQSQLQSVGIATFGDFLKLDIDACTFTGPQKAIYHDRRAELDKMAEKVRIEEMANTPMSPVDANASHPEEDSPAAPEDKPEDLAGKTSEDSLPEEKSISLGRQWDPRATVQTPETVLLPTEDLLRHVFIAGGTGSGKTVLAKVLLEEVASKGIPSIVIDPAGDLGQLWMKFPFDPSESERVAIAKEQIEIHCQGGNIKASLRKWKEILENHFKLQKDGGVSQANILKNQQRSFVRLLAPIQNDMGLKLALPPFDPQVLSRLPEEDEDEHHTRVALATEELTATLGLTGEKAGRIGTVLINLVVQHPQRFQVENPLLALRNAFDRLPTLLPNIQGMSVNSYVESRLCLEFQRAIVTYQAGSGAPWLSGMPFDLDVLMESDSDCAPINVISIQHLSNEDQQRAVARIISKVDHWMHQSSSQGQPVRALVYLDELGGGGGGKLAFLPPVAKPSSKPPLMRLVKQARKYGVGCVFATQNVKDIDYQALANINSWFVGKMNNERERGYITDGIANATMVGFPRSMIQGL